MSISMRAFRAAVVCAAALWTAQAFADDDCHPLTQFATVELAHRPNNSRLYVPVTIEGKDRLMLLDTGGAMSEITLLTANELQLGRRQLQFQEVDLLGNTSNEAADVNQFEIGALIARSIEFVISPDHNLFADNFRYAGIIAPNILKNYDVDIDFGGPRLTLLSPEHCEGKVIYWPASAVAVVPMRVLKSGHIAFSAMLDGKPVSAMLDTGASNTTLKIPVAESDFGLKMGTPDTPRASELNGKPGATVYHHKFASLDFDGLAVSNLEVALIPDYTSDKYKPGPELGTRLGDTSQSGDFADMLLGMNVLRHLHVYIAYKERKLYITPAGPPNGTAAAH